MTDLRLLIIIVDPIIQTESKPEEVHYYIHIYIYTVISCGEVAYRGRELYFRQKWCMGQRKPIGARAELVYMVGWQA
jgi:hypothetical protein